jgi:hypothetical protein
MRGGPLAWEIRYILLTLCNRYDDYLTFLMLFYFPDFSRLTGQREESGHSDHLVQS